MSYLKPNTKKAIRIITAIKGFTATIATATYITMSHEWTLVVLVVGAAATEIINLLSNNDDPNSLV